MKDLGFGTSGKVGGRVQIEFLFACAQMTGFRRLYISKEGKDGNPA